jgi:hypothetical protein
MRESGGGGGGELRRGRGGEKREREKRERKGGEGGGERRNGRGRMVAVNEGRTAERKNGRRTGWPEGRQNGTRGDWRPTVERKNLGHYRVILAQVCTQGRNLIVVGGVLVVTMRGLVINGGQNERGHVSHQLLRRIKVGTRCGGEIKNGKWLFSNISIQFDFQPFQLSFTFSLILNTCPSSPQIGLGILKVGATMRTKRRPKGGTFLVAASQSA